MKWEHLVRMKAYAELIDAKKTLGFDLQRKNDYLSFSEERTRERTAALSSEILELQQCLFSALSEPQKQ